MLISVKGTYQNGHIVLDEPAPTNETVPALVIFLGKRKARSKIGKKNRGLERKISIPDDFNEPFDDLEEFM